VREPVDDGVEAFGGGFAEGPSQRELGSNHGSIQWERIGCTGSQRRGAPLDSRRVTPPDGARQSLRKAKLFYVVSDAAEKGSQEMGSDGTGYVRRHQYLDTLSCKRRSAIRDEGGSRVVADGIEVRKVPW